MLAVSVDTWNLRPTTPEKLDEPATFMRVVKGQQAFVHLMTGNGDEYYFDAEEFLKVGEFLR